MTKIAEANKKLDDGIMSGKAMEVFEELYADDVVMQENTEQPYVGKAFNRDREIEFFKNVEAFHNGVILSQAVQGNTSFTELEMEVTLKGVGRITMTQVARRKWNDAGKVVHERFYHK